MSSNLPRYTLRVPKDLLEKIAYIAGANGRSANKEIEMLLKRYVTQYEKKHGPIEPGDKPTEST